MFLPLYKTAENYSAFDSASEAARLHTHTHTHIRGGGAPVRSSCPRCSIAPVLREAARSCSDTRGQATRRTAQQQRPASSGNHRALRASRWDQAPLLLLQLLQLCPRNKHCAKKPCPLETCSALQSNPVTGRKVILPLSEI